MAVDVPALATATARLSRARRRRETWQAYVLLSPAMVIFIVFTFIPIVWTILLSLENYDIFTGQAAFVGLYNYQQAVQNPTFWQSLAVTAYYMFGSVPITVALALLVAVLLNRKGLRIAGVLQTLFFLPYIVASVGSSLVWKWILDTNFGLLNGLLALVGLRPVPWLTSPTTAMPALIMMSVWGGIGFAVVLFQAGLRAIPAELHEAALIDGANGRQRFWRITFPLLSPVTLFVLIISLIKASQVFTSVQVMTAGGPLNATNVLVYYIYQ